MSIDKSIGEKVKQMRKIKSISQKELASRLGIAANTLYRYECGDIAVSVDMLKKIADALNVMIVEILDLPLSPVEFSETPEGVQTRELSGAETKILIEQLNQRSAQSQLLAAFGQLNDDGQRVAVERVEELADIPKYKK